MSKLVVERHLYHAWLEYGDTAEDYIDGIAFDRSVASSLGWKNLFNELVPGANPRTRVSVNLQVPMLDIQYLRNPHQPQEEGLIARPAKEHSPFLARWAVNPGVTPAYLPPGVVGSSSCLTYDSMPQRAEADLLAVSGHGGFGTVYRENDARLPVADGFRNNMDLASSGRLKYLLVATCGNCGDFASSAWLSALQRNHPVHGVLGYSEKYTGGDKGARVMRKFALTMWSKPDMPIMQAWAEANHGLLPWGAVLHERAIVEDTSRKWHSAGGLADFSPNGRVFHFNAANIGAGGKEVRGWNSKIRVSWVVDGIVVDERNNDISLPQSVRKCLTQGASCKIRFKHADGRFFRGQKIEVIFYWVRRAKTEMNLDTILEFDSRLLVPEPATGAPRIQMRRDAHQVRQLDAEFTRSATGANDGILYTVAAGGSDVEEIDFTVRRDAKAHYPAIGDGTHGSFWFESNLDNEGRYADFGLQRVSLI